MLFKVTLVIHFLKSFSFKFFGLLDDISKLLGHFTLKNNQIGQKSEGKILLPMLVMIWKPSTIPKHRRLQILKNGAEVN